MKSQIPRFIKVCIILLILVLMYYQLVHGAGMDAVKQTWYRDKSHFQYRYLVLTFILMPINWLLEAVKWQKLMSPFQTISIKNAIKTILAGISMGIVTPARLGEYGGRLLASNPDQKTQVISSTLLGSIAQNLCNVVGGLGFSYFFLKTVFNVTYLDQFTFIWVVSIQIFLFVALYYNLPKVVNFVNSKIKNKWILKYSSKLTLLDKYHTQLLHQVLVISVLRYVVYFLQYVFILEFLDLHIEIGQKFGNIAGIYLIQSGIPLPAFLGVFARGELAILVWSQVQVDQLSALVATFGLWFINLILPSILGLIVLSETNFNKYFSTK